MIRILIADDHDVVRAGLLKLLGAQPGWEVVAIAGDGREALAKAIDTKPDVAVIDYSLPVFNGIEVTRRLRAQVPSTEILIFTMHCHETLFMELLQAGARGYLLKSDANSYLIAAIKSLAAHKPFFTRELPAASAGQPSSGGSTLTAREGQVVRLIAEGHTNKVIARSLDISLKTVESHRAAVMRKLGVSSSAALVRYAVRNKLIDP